ncbi:unnamed protein product [Protopolystoma xenopodis]|uniref:Uncharacterized protein n=1 Tax=Protopolystoma xenopodis TaxID=117903 RepID=A0A3S5C0D1_9PLAT|nr:unnamed protein product [Protopolystoma xenopodis]
METDEVFFCHIRKDHESQGVPIDFIQHEQPVDLMIRLISSQSDLEAVQPNSNALTNLSSSTLLPRRCPDLHAFRTSLWQSLTPDLAGKKTKVLTPLLIRLVR